MFTLTKVTSIALQLALAGSIGLSTAASASSDVKEAFKPVVETLISEGGADRLRQNRIAEGGSDRLQQNRVAEGGSDRLQLNRIAEGGADRVTRTRV